MKEGVVIKSQRDLDAEVGIDKLLEQINKAVDAKLIALDIFITKGADDSASMVKLEQEIVATGDILILWNSIARVYTKAGVSRQSQELIKVKLVNIKNGIDALVYGSNRIVDAFTSKVIELLESNEEQRAIVLFKLMTEFINSYGVYSLIQRQIETGSVSVISPPDVSAEVEDYVATKSDFFQLLLKNEKFLNIRDRMDKDITPRFNLRSRYLPSQLDQIREEYGLRPNQQTGLAIAKLKAKDAEQVLSNIKSSLKDPVFADMKQQLARLIQEQKDLEADHARLERSMRDDGIALDALRRRIQKKEDDIEDAKAKGEKFGRIANGLSDMKKRAVDLERQLQVGEDRLGEIELRDTEVLAEIEFLIDQITRTATDLGFFSENPEPEMRTRVINERGADYWGRAEPVSEEDEKGEAEEKQGRGLATMDDDYYEEHLSSSDSEEEDEKFVPYKHLPHSTARNDFYRLHRGK
jgi:hypothetical protein